MASYDHAEYGDPLPDVRAELGEAVRRVRGAGVAADRIVVDPGLGFAKRPETNYAVLRGLGVIAGLGHPVMVGPSRKRFLGRDLPDEAARDRATAAVCVAAHGAGASLFRVHAVGPVREALDVAHRVRGD